MSKTLLRDELCPICGEGRYRVWAENHPDDPQQAILTTEYCWCMVWEMPLTNPIDSSKEEE